MADLTEAAAVERGKERKNRRLGWPEQKLDGGMFASVNSGQNRGADCSDLELYHHQYTKIDRRQRMGMRHS